MPAAARKFDPIEHESLLAQIGKVGTGLLAGLAVGVAFGAAAALVVGTGGLGAVVLGAVVATGMQFGADKLAHAAGVPGPSDLPGMLSDAAGGVLDQIFPPTIVGNIVQGSPNVFINGRPAARAIGGEADDNRAICGRHTPVQHLAEGSETVFINTWPAHRVSDRLDCSGKTAKGSSNVFIGGPPVQTRAIASDMPWWLEWGSMALGIALAVCTRNWKSIPGKLLCLGIGMGASAVTNWALSSAFGKPVHAPTGAKFLDGSDDLDFELPATLPLPWVRTYNSMDTADGLLGPGWRLPVGVTLTVSGGRFTLTDQKGIEIPFGEVAAEAATHNVSYGWTLGRVRSGLCVAKDPDGIYYDFGPYREGTALLLQRMEDRSGNRIALRYDEAGRLIELTDGAGRRYACEYDPVHVRRLAAVTCASAGGRPLVSYGYDSEGRLVSVTNRAGEVVRQFSWHRSGPGEGLIASQTMPSGLVCHYEWTEIPGSHPRIARHWTSAGEEWRASYRIRIDGRVGVTTVTDHLGRVQRWEWAGPFQITSYTDALGRTWRWQYNNAGLPVTCTEPDGGVWSHSYNERGDIVAAVDPMGGTYSTTWHDGFDLPESETEPDGATTRYEYDGRGNLIAATHPGGRVQFLRNRRGELTARRDESGRESTWERRPDGQAASYTDCSGKVTRWAYDGEGRLVAATDAAGHVTRLSWDEAGRLASQRAPDGTEITWCWTAGGYMASQERAGARTQYTWDQSGRLTRVIDPVGNVVERQYDAAGRLAALIDGAGQETRFAYDAADGLIAEVGIDGLRTEYRLDVRRFPVEVVQAAGTGAAVRLTLERDLRGRLVAKRTFESLTRYTYDPAGRVVAVKRFAPDSVTLVDEIDFGYDAVGRLVEETAAVHRVARRGAVSAGRPGAWQWDALPAPRQTAIRHQRDVLGNIAVTTLPHGPAVRYLRYGSGHLLQINLGATVVAEMTRDDLHREVERSQGAIEARFRLDPMGRRLSYRTGLPEDERGPGAAEVGVPSGAMAKEYRYDAQGLLAQRRDAWQGPRRFEYDPAGRITASTFGFGGHPGPRDEEFGWDAASNVLPLDRALRVISGETVQNRVLRWNGSTYTYDTHGRLTRKRTASGNEIFLAWNSEHQLVQSWSERGGEWTYHYDALGRRIAKERHENGDVVEATWFVWDGMRMVQEEQSPGQCITTVYEDAGSYVPLARAEHPADERTVRPGQIFHFHTDVNGAPEELTTHDGRTAWRARYQTWGNLALEEWSTAAQGDPAPQPRVQNLRFQGQYYDAETGLHYNTFRYYDPDVGRFISQDPIGLRGGLNLYQYAPDPLAWVDPWGLAGNPANVTLYNGYVLGSHEDVQAWNRANNVDASSHHIVQDDAVAKLPGYERQKAPTIGLIDRWGTTGSEHWSANAAQRQATRYGTLGVEKSVGVNALKAAGVPDDVIAKAMGNVDKYFKGIGATDSTTTKKPGNRC